jgi:hypothetical protein
MKISFESSERKFPKNPFSSPTELLCCPCPHGFDSGLAELTHLIEIRCPKDRDDRRQSVELVFVCEDGHKFGVRYEQHSGSTSVSRFVYESVNPWVAMGDAESL